MTLVASSPVLLFWSFRIPFVICLFQAVSSSLFRNPDGARNRTRKLIEHIPPNCNPHFHDVSSVTESSKIARSFLTTQNTSVPIARRLAVMILFSGGFTDTGRVEWLRCGIRKLIQNMASDTPSDIYIWVGESTYNNTPAWMKDFETQRVFVLPIPKNTWLVPCGLSDDSLWAVRKHFSLDYYLMGRWRLTFSLDFVREMGYKYHLQYDDDAILNSRIGLNIVQKMEKYDMAVFSDRVWDGTKFVSGLAELTKYWMYIEKFEAKGPIVKDLWKEDIKTLSTDGWKKEYRVGYFLLLSVDFYFSGTVQSFLRTVLRSGRDVEGRWQEQAVLNMIRLIIIPPERLWTAVEVNIGHDRHKKSNFLEWCGEKKNG